MQENQSVVSRLQKSQDKACEYDLDQQDTDLLMNVVKNLSEAQTLQIKEEMFVSLKRAAGKRNDQFSLIKKVVNSQSFLKFANPTNKNSFFRAFSLQVPQDHFSPHMNVSINNSNLILLKLPK